MLIAIVVVVVVIIAAVAAVLLTSTTPTPTKPTNWLDRGFKMEIYYNTGNSARQTAATLMKTNLEKLNPGKIVITVTGLEWSVYLQKQQSGAMPAYWLGWAPDYADPNDYTVPFLLSGGTFPQTIGYHNATLDALVQQAGSDVNPVTRANELKNVSLAAQKEAIYIWLSQGSVLTCMRSWVSGFAFNPLYSNLIYYLLNKTASSTTPDTFTMGEISGNPQYLDPAQDYETAGGEVLQNVMETLIFYNGSHTDEFTPVLCTEVPTLANGGINASGLNYTFHIRPGVTFQDGSAFTAADVVFSVARELRLNDPHGPAWIIGEVMIPDYYNATKNPAGVFGAGGNITATSGVPMSAIQGAVWAKNDTTVQFNLTQKDPAFISRLAFNSVSIVSLTNTLAHSSNKPYSQTAFTWVNTNPIGTGPYKFQEFQANQFISLTRYDDYWAGPAKIKNILLKQYATDNARLSALKLGDVDAAIIPRTIQESLYPDVTSGNVVMTNSSSLNVNFMGLNQDINTTGLNPTLNDIPSNFFADVKVRQAFNYAFDFNTFNNQTLKGTAIQPNGPIPKGLFGYVAPPEVPVYEFNLTKAANLLRSTVLPPTASVQKTTVLDSFIAKD
ncbi:MAG: ABC transporter substrate-binding protein [Methanomassiliicoccales archaeon]|jgi:ABC-type transport system substrate-binding protein|nr:ABC transporter substrate-binding protein [Methanomassiliicoccales archaeon]